MNEQTLALITGKSLIFATKLIEAVKKLPKFEVTWSLVNRKEAFVKNQNGSSINDETVSVELACSMLNFEDLTVNGGTLGFKNKMVIMVGDSNNNLIYSQRLK